jgi:ADP-ribosylglycohydrolase
VFGLEVFRFRVAPADPTMPGNWTDSTYICLVVAEFLRQSGVLQMPKFDKDFTCYVEPAGK